VPERILDKKGVAARLSSATMEEDSRSLATMEEALQAAGDVDSLSFYGLAHWLEKVNESLDVEDVEMAQRRDELLEAQSNLRRAMGTRLERPSLTRREQPLAEAFLRQQLAKLESSAPKSGDSRVANAIARLKQILEAVTTTAPAPEACEVRETELEIKQLAAEWKEVELIQKKWEAGKHKFKAVSDLQDFKRRYRDCEKGRFQVQDKLQKLLCSVRDEAAATKLAEQEVARAAAIKSGWMGVASAKSKPAPKSTRAALRPPLPTAKRVPIANSWASSEISFAQRMRAQMEAQVRAEDTAEVEAGGQEEEEEVEEEDYEEEEEEMEATVPVQPTPLLVPPKKPPPMPPPKAPVAVPPLAAAQAAPKAEAAEEDDDDDKSGTMPPTTSTTSQRSGKKGKSGKKKSIGATGSSGVKRDEGEEEMEQANEAPQRKSPVVSAWAAQVEASICGLLLHDLLRPESWGLLDVEAAADCLEVLTDRLAWTSPLGFTLPLDWKEFFGLEIDGGPQRTSKRGTSPWVLRLQANVPLLLGHYVTMFFFAALLHDLSNFGLLLWVALMQVVLLLIPPSTIPAPTRVLALQGAHILLWLCFVRSLWLIHFFIKCFGVLTVAGHAYAIKPYDES